MCPFLLRKKEEKEEKEQPRIVKSVPQPSSGFVCIT
jgi:hypothetical protein